MIWLIYYVRPLCPSKKDSADFTLNYTLNLRWLSASYRRLDRRSFSVYSMGDCRPLCPTLRDSAEITLNYTLNLRWISVLLACISATHQRLFFIFLSPGLYYYT